MVSSVFSFARCKTVPARRNACARSFAPSLASALYLQDMNEAERLLAPMLVQCPAHRPAHRLGERVGVAAPRPRQVLDGGDHRIEHDVVEFLASHILLGDADKINLGILGK